jgi:hypothetical protein
MMLTVFYIMLLCRMLTVDPVRRLTLDQIHVHPWLLEHFPPDMAPQPVYEVDEVALAKITDSLGYSRNDTLSVS